MRRAWKILFLVLISLAALSICGADENGSSVAVVDEHGMDEKMMEEHGAEEAMAGEHGEEEHEPGDAVLFPFFMLIIGVLAYYFLSRYAEWMPYTAFMFIIGAGIGVAVTRNEREIESLLHITIDDFWVNIDGELLLLSFLPGLIYHDAQAQNTHLFERAFVQCSIFAFPLVLAGTVLTALIGFYILPYDWSFNLSMTFGAILSATDPVAVAALLDAVGAPPRLKVHIAGESLLNDGAAIVFFNIFSCLFLAELGVEGLGEEIDLPRGVAIFFQKSVGAAVVGLLFTFGFLPLMNALSRGLETEENVVQTGLTITTAYLCYFTAEIALGTSGVIAVLTLGVLGKAFGQIYVNDHELVEHFWKITEWLLNSVLFGLGGILWGTVIANKDPEFPEAEFNGHDWGYLILVYILITVIRLVLFAAVFPLISTIGLKSCWQEMIFQSLGGLRGAVGISLAIFLDNTVRSNAGAEAGVDVRFVLQSNKLYGLVGGIAFLTLAVNGVVAGPLLKKLGLSDVTDTRQKMLQCYRLNFREHALKAFVRVLGQERFKKVNFDLVRVHCAFLNDLTVDELKAAIVRYERATVDADQKASAEAAFRISKKIHKVETSMSVTNSTSVRVLGATSKKHLAKVFSKPSLPEIRRLFLELVRAAYECQVKEGELGRREFVAYSLFESIDYAIDDVEKGCALNDWYYIDQSHTSLEEKFRQFLLLLRQHPLSKKFGRTKDHDHDNSQHSHQRRHSHGHQSHLHHQSSFEEGASNAKLLRIRTKVERCLAFINAHNHAAAVMKHEFHNSSEIEGVEVKVLEESRGQVKMAEAFLTSLPEDEVELVVSHKVSKIILNKTVHYVKELSEARLLKDQEAGAFLEELQHAVDHVESCFGGCKLASSRHVAPPKQSLEFHQEEEVPSALEEQVEAAPDHQDGQDEYKSDDLENAQEDNAPVDLENDQA